MPLGALDIIIAADTAQLRKGMDTAVSIMQSSTKTMEDVAKNSAKAIVGYFTFDAIRDSISNTLDFAESINHVRQAAGMTAEQVYALSATAKLADVNFEALTSMTAKFNKGLGEASMGSGNAKIAMDYLGLSLKDSQGHMIGSYDQLGKIADKFKEMPDGASKTTLAMELFGKSGADMIPILNSGSEALQEYLGIMDNETTAAAENFNDSMTRIGMTTDSIYTQMVASLAPTLNAIADDFNDVAKEGKDTGHTLGGELAEGMKLAIQLGYQIVGSFSMAGHAVGNFGAAVSLLAEGDFKGAKFAWNKMQTDFEEEGKSWDARLKKVTEAKSSDISSKTGGRGKDLGFEDEVAAKNAEAAIKKAQKEIEAAAKKAYDDELKLLDNRQKANIDYYTSIGDTSNLFNIQEAEKMQKLAASGILNNQQMLEVYAADTKKYLEAKAQLEFQADEQAKEAIKTYDAGLLTSKIDYYTALKDYSSAYYYQEEEKMKKLAETGWYTHEQMLAIKKSDDEKFQKEQWDRDHKFWADTFVNINKAMEDQFFNAMSGKFTSFGNWLKDFWSSITQSMSRGLSKSIADSIMGTNDSGGGIQNIFKSFGGLGSVFGSAAIPAALIGATRDSAGFTTTKGGTVYDAAGQVTKQGSDYADVLNAINVASTANTAYSILTGGLASIGTNIATGFGYLAEGLNYVGLTSAGAGVSEFGLGVGSIFTGGADFAGMSAMGAGQLLGGAAVGAIGGYALGSIGDSIFGADTRAGSYGAIGGGVGGAIGTFILPGVGTAIGASIGAALGSLVGGMFGSTKVKGSGYYFGSSTEDGSNAQTYIDYKKKSWFSSSSWTTYSPLSEVEKSKIKGLFDTYDYLLVQLGTSKEITLAAGRYAGTTFQDQLAKNFITAFTDVEQSSSTFSTIYSYWTDYAKSINQTISQAFATSIGTYVSSTRSFNEWKLGSGTVEQLKFTSEYLTKDLAALENQMGVSGITVENYLSKYDEAMKSSFTPETITSWKNLGDALIAATDANTKYTDSIKALTTYTKPSDMMLSRVGDATSITGKSDGTVNSAMLEVLQKMWKELQNQTTIAQLNRGMA